MKQAAKIIFNMFLFFCNMSFAFKCNYSERASKLQKQYIKEIKKKYDLTVCGTGAAMPDDIKELKLCFEKEGCYSINEVRELYVKVADGFIDLINDDTAIRPYLHEYPFTENNIELGIIFEDEMGHFVNSNYVASVDVINGKIYFKYYDSKEGRLKNITVEPYQEAREKVYSQQNQNKETL